MLDKIVDSVKRDTAVVSYDASASVCIGKSRYDVRFARHTDFRSVGIKYALVVGFVVFGKNLVELGIGLVAVLLKSFFRHLDSAVRHKSSFKRLVGLKTYNFFKVFFAFKNVSRFVGIDIRNDVGIHIENAALFPLFCLQFLQFSPKLVCSFRRFR